MASTYSLRFRLNFQAPGDNLNTWGAILNTGVFQLMEDAIAKRVAFALSGPKTLTSVNGAGDEARCAFLDITGGTGGSITAPSVEKLYVVRNGASGDVAMTTGAGTTATFKPGEIGWAVGDGVNFRKTLSTDYGGARISGLSDPSAAQDAATKAYVDASSFAAAAGNLPGQLSQAGKFLTTNGANASWGSAWSPANMHVSPNADAVSGTLQMATSGDVGLGGLRGGTDGSVNLINSAGGNRLATGVDGSVTARSDAGVSNLLATQAFAIASAVAL